MYVCINNHRSSDFRSNHRSFIASVLFCMVRNCRTTLIRQLQRFFNDRWSCLMSVVLQFRTIRNSTVAINDRWLLLRPELLWVLIVNALQLNELSAIRNTFYPEYKYVCMYITAFASISSLVVQNEALLFAVNRSLTWTLDHRCGRWKLEAAENLFSCRQPRFRERRVWKQAKVIQIPVN